MRLGGIRNTASVGYLWGPSQCDSVCRDDHHRCLWDLCSGKTIPGPKSSKAWLTRQIYGTVEDSKSQLADEEVDPVEEVNIPLLRTQNDAGVTVL